MEIFFLLFGGLSILGGLGVLLAKRPISGVLWLAVNFLSLGGVYILAKATFLGIIQILLYAGAVIVLFLFFLMLLRVGKPKEDLDLSVGGFIIALFILALFGGLYIAVAFLNKGPSGKFLKGGAGPIADLFLSRYILPFEVMSLILLIALITAFLFAKRSAS